MVVRVRLQLWQARSVLWQGEAATQALIDLLAGALSNRFGGDYGNQLSCFGHPEGRSAQRCDAWSSELALALARAGPERGQGVGGRCSCLSCKTRKRMVEAVECGPEQKCR